MIGRNDPCPCGSGKKYKKCCLGKLAEPGEVLAWQNVQARQWIQVDHKLCNELFHRLKQYPEAVNAALDRMNVAEADEGFALNWIAHHLPINGRTVAQAFHQSGKMSADVRRLLECQLESPLSIFEVQEIQPGRGVRLKDLLLEEEFFLWDVGISQSVQAHAGMLGWVLPMGQVTLTGGMHSTMLPPHLLQSVREALKGRRLTRADLLGAKGETLIQLWQQTLENWASSPPPQLANMDGDPLTWVEDRFTFPSPRRPEVWAALLALPGAEATDDDTIGFSEKRADAPLDNISVGTARVEAEEILLSSNSSKRADRLRKAVEKACTGLDLQKKRRKTRDFEVPKAPAMSQEQLMQLPEVQAKIAEMRQRMNEKWLELKKPSIRWPKSPRTGRHQGRARQTGDHHERIRISWRPSRGDSLAAPATGTDSMISYQDRGIRR